MRTWETTPVIILNLNLPPWERVQTRNILLSLLIPGPNQPKELDSFLQPLVDELLILHRGVLNTLSLDGTFFTLKAHTLHCAGDGPAIAGLMGCKKPGVALQSCPSCWFRGTRIGNTGPYYLPYTPDQIAQLHHKTNTHYRSVVDTWVGLIPSSKTEWGKELRISKRSILMDLPTLDFPSSFPLDLMHTVLQNLVPQLYKLWGGGDTRAEQESGLRLISKLQWRRIANM